MEKELRKVRFNLNEQNLSLDELDYEDSNGIMDEHHGVFHRWGDVFCYDPRTESNIQKVVAIVEEEGTGKIYEIAPHCITFL